VLTVDGIGLGVCQ